MKMGTFTFVPDDTGCEHQFIVGPQRKQDQFHIGWCDNCRREVVIEFEGSDQSSRTGRTWLIQYGPITNSE